MNIRPDTRSLVLLYHQAPLSIRTITPDADLDLSTSNLGDGTHVRCNEEGRVVFVQYKSGVRVKRNEHNVLVSTPDNCFWLGDGLGRWYRLD